MVRIVPLKKEHLDRIKAQGAQDYVSEWLTPAIRQDMEDGMSFAAVDGEEVLACAGVVEYWAGRGAAWAIMSDNIGKRFLAVHNAVKKFLQNTFYRRLEATTDLGFCNGHRWLVALGFRLETGCMPGYLPNGQDAAMYVRCSV